MFHEIGDSRFNQGKARTWIRLECNFQSFGLVQAQLSRLNLGSGMNVGLDPSLVKHGFLKEDTRWKFDWKERSHYLVYLLRLFWMGCWGDKTSDNSIKMSRSSSRKNIVSFLKRLSLVEIFPWLQDLFFNWFDINHHLGTARRAIVSTLPLPLLS